jgi:hypothetical protein
LLAGCGEYSKDGILWASVWLADDGTAYTVVGDDKLLIYDSEARRCAVSASAWPDYYNIGPCTLMTPGDRHILDVTLLVYDAGVPQLVLIDSEVQR